MDTIYEKMNKKLDKLLDKQNPPTKGHYTGHPSMYPRTVNLTDIKFTKEEQQLLDLGPQYNFQKPASSTWENIILETERAIRLLQDKLQDSFRIITAKKLKQICNSSQPNTTHKRQLHTLKQIKQKITNNNAMISRADKGKTTVIIYTHDFNDKVHNFLSENNFRMIQNPTTIDQRNIKNATTMQ
jgi:hypothetical protein